MTSEILQTELWDKISILAKHAKRKHIAVAYVGDKAFNLLPLSKGDTLVVDMSEATVKSGQTDPFEIEKYRNKGVSVFTCSNLHAKIYIFDNAVIVSSANIASRSKSTLVESGLLSRDRNIVTAARGIVRSLQVEPISSERLKRAKKLYKPPRFPNTGAKPKRKRPFPTFSRLWIIKTVDDPNQAEYEEILCKKEESQASKRIKDKKLSEIESLRWRGISKFTKSLRVGDHIVQIYNNGKTERVFEASDVGRLTRYRAKNKFKSPRIFIHLEVSKRPHTVMLERFMKLLSQSGFKSVVFRNENEVTAPSLAHTILGILNK